MPTESPWGVGPAHHTMETAQSKLNVNPMTWHASRTCRLTALKGHNNHAPLTPLTEVSLNRPPLRKLFAKSCTDVSCSSRSVELLVALIACSPPSACGSSDRLGDVLSGVEAFAAVPRRLGAGIPFGEVDACAIDSMTPMRSSSTKGFILY